jgi:hypothetical protein
MNPTLAKLLLLEGRTVAVALTNGLRIEKCKLVALPTGLTAKFWLFTDDCDMVVTPGEVADVWAPVAATS